MEKLYKKISPCMQLYKTLVDCYSLYKLMFSCIARLPIDSHHVTAPLRYRRSRALLRLEENK